ncbi:glycosyltransferase family 4 protein [Patescibacteria group bacterium]|nr:glycosyltransferase family 4 protein [Patescibacteria group bacterium]
MKIAQIVCVLPPKGGIGMVAHAYSEQLVERGHDVTVFIPEEKNGAPNGMKYKIKQLRPCFRAGHAALLPQFLWRLKDFDIVHLHFPFFGAALFVALAKKFKKDKMKLVLSYHMDVEFKGLRGLYCKLYWRYFVPFILDQADKIIVSSDDYIESSDIQEYYFKNINKFVELPFGVPKKYHPEKKNEDLLQKYGLQSSDKIIGFVGGLDSAHYFKGVNFLIKAISLLPDESIKALVVGRGNLKQEYEKLAKEMGLESRVRFADSVESADLPAHYNLFDYFVLPSINKSEAFGIVLLEAMACGKPLIASYLKGVRSVVDQGINGLMVEPKNSKDIADKISFLINNPENARNFGERGVKTVEEKYRWSKIAAKLEEIYKKL